MRKYITSILGLTLMAFNCSSNAQTLTGLQLWLKPEGLTNTVNTSKVSFWTNSVGGGNDATNGTVVNQPVYRSNALSGYPVVRFTDDGSNATGNTNLNWLVSPLPLSANSNSFTAVIVFESQITGQRDTLIQQLGNGQTILYVQTNAVAGLNPNIDSFASGKELPSPYSYAVQNWTILALVQDVAAGTVTLYQNGSMLTNTSIGTTATLANAGWLFGCNKNKNTHGLNGDIAEVLVYNQALNSTDVGNTTAYLANKYGFVVLTDNFNTPDTTDLNANLATRQAGSAAPTTYFTQYPNLADSVGIVGNQVQLSLTVASGFDTAVFAPSVDFIHYAGGNYHISYDVTGLTNSSGNPANTWVGLIAGSAYSTINPANIDGFETILQWDGSWVVWPQGFFGPGANTGSVTQSNSYHIDLIVQNSVATYLINNQLVGIYSLACGANANNVSLSLGSSVNATATMDNFAFTGTPTASEILPNLPASLKLSDAFNAANSPDINATVAARQTGSAAPITWNTNGSLNTAVSLTGNAMLMANSPIVSVTNAVGMASPNVDFRQLEHLNSFRLKFTVAGSNDATSNDSWVGVRFRDNKPSLFMNKEDGGGTGINLFTGDGRWYLFQSVLGATNAIMTPASGTVPVASSYSFEIDVRANILRIKINGQSLLLGCGTDTYQLSPAQAANFITLECFASPAVTTGTATFDDFTFESLDPGFTVPSPTIVNPALAGSAFNLSFNSGSDVFYAVDSKTVLTSPAWNYLGGVVGNGGLVSYTNSPATNNPQFYRLRVP